MNNVQAKLYHDFKNIAGGASAVEVDDSNFVRHFNYDGIELEISYSDNDGGYNIFIESISDEILNGDLGWNENSQSFTVLDTDGYQHDIRFMNVIPIERI